MFVELHARSAFSFLEGASLPEYLVATAAALQMPAMALLDRDGVYGAPRFHLAAEKAGIKAHMGAEINCSAFSFAILNRFVGAGREPGTEWTDPYSQREITEAGSPRFARNDKSKSTGNEFHGNFRLPLLVANRTGYQNLCRLITKMKMRAKKDEGTVHEYELEEHAAGLKFSDAKMFTWNCSAICTVKKKRATVSPWKSRMRSVFLCSPPTVWRTPPPKNANYAMFSPLSATIARWPQPDACSPAIPSAA